MSEVNEEVNNDPTGQPEEYDRSRQKINLGPHPLGGVLLEITDAYGRTSAIQLDQQMLSQMVLTLITMNVMMTTQDASERARAEQALAKEVWTPNG